ncbi:fumarylacetoacetate hydrolase domain-containing protein 2A-like isoform X2 [Cinclus cinclus]|uniref:fumarylacetoacetate hydrolase domain-containing protein 2A-like isoform X2 n=1 Tax=Cinclus cinclus TaxID=127875 RepID=UPI002E154333
MDPHRSGHPNLHAALDDPKVCYPPAVGPPKRALESGQHRVPRVTARLLAPVGDPEKVICVGLNYHDHCKEQAVKVPKEPLIFSKFPSAITGPYDDIVHPQDTSELDWEVELAAIIGKRGRHIEEAVALEHVLGFTVANDVSARDWQMRRNGRQWLLGKTFDTFCPLGPAIVTREALAGWGPSGTTRVAMPPHDTSHRYPQPVDSLQCQWAPYAGQQHLPPHLWGARPRRLGLPVGMGELGTLKVQGAVADTSCVPRFVTLVPGDILLTGTPAGVGVFRKPPVFLKRGDEVQCEIEELGTICNRVV